MKKKKCKSFTRPHRQLASRLTERKLTLELDDKARTWLCDRGYEPAYGARPLNRVLSRFVMNPLAKALLDGSVRDGEKVSFAVENGELRLVGNHSPGPQPHEADDA